jgi:hypothetical protein
MKDYTALLLNCYIKQKKINKLKDFVEKKNISDQPLDVETAIEVCKDTNQIDLALSIAEKANMSECYIQIMIEFKSIFDNNFTLFTIFKFIHKAFLNLKNKIITSNN